MVAAQDVHRRDVDHRMSARTRQPEHLGQRRALVVVPERIKHVEGRHQVERLAGEWDGGDRWRAPGRGGPAIAPMSRPVVETSNP